MFGWGTVRAGWHGMQAHDDEISAHEEERASERFEKGADWLGHHPHIPGTHFLKAEAAGQSAAFKMLGDDAEEQAQLHAMKVHVRPHGGAATATPPPAKAPAAGAGDEEDDADGGGPSPAPVKRFVAIALLPAFWL
jgi:hypothetical protein